MKIRLFLAALLCAIPALAHAAGANRVLGVTDGGTGATNGDATGAVFPAKNYGSCTWDAAHDVGPCINAALAACVAAGGGTAVLPPGQFRVTSQISLVSKCGLHSAAGGSTLKGGDASTYPMVSANGVSDVSVKGIVFDGNAVARTDFGNLLQVYNSARVDFDGIKVQHSRGIGLIFSTNVSNSGVRNSSFDDIGRVWEASGQTGDAKPGIAFCCGAPAGNLGNYAINNTLTGIGLDAISATNQTGAVVRGNVIPSKGGLNLPGSLYSAGIYVFAVDGISISENTISGSSGHGIDIANSSRVRVIGNDVRTSYTAGISVAAGADAGQSTSDIVISGNTVKNNEQAGAAPVNSYVFGGITLYANTNGIKNVVISANVSGDDQATPTQQYGIAKLTAAGGTISNVWIDQSNILVGNVAGQFENAAYSSVAMTGGFTPVALPGSGNTRGANAVDLQTAQSIPAHVANGTAAALLGGQNNLASANYSIVPGGIWNLGNAEGGLVAGTFLNPNYQNGHHVFGFGRFNAQGDAQASVWTARAVSTDATPARLLAAATTNEAISNTNALSLLNNTTWSGTIQITATNAANGDTADWTARVVAYRAASADTTVVKYVNIVKNFADTGASAWAVLITADTARGGLNISGTGAAGKTIRWFARLDMAEKAAN